VSFIDLDIEREYKTFRNNIVTEFYVPALSEAKLYKRAVGFFTSKALVEMSKGIVGLLNNNGMIQFIVSPLLQKEDIQAIEKGYNLREIVVTSILREFREPESKSEEERLNWMAHLISTGDLDIKVAFTPPSSTTGMYHEKMGILVDKDDNTIAFSGSMNETLNAFVNNYESIDVFVSWKSEDAKRVQDKIEAFDLLWNNEEANVTVMDFPEAAKEKLQSYKKQHVNHELDKLELTLEPEAVVQNVPVIPSGKTLYLFQQDAIKKWVENNYCGIFDMATGTGKTYTGLGAAARVYADKKRVAIIIVCPFQHLVEQWVEDIILFNLKPIIGYSSSAQRDWLKRLKNDVLDFKLGVIDCMCFVTTNSTFSLSYTQKQLKKLGADTLLIVDEAHNFGAFNLSQSLSDNVQYRLALSATIERHRDEEGTQRLFSYFGKKCIEYGLERAIREDKLTPYYYHPNVVYLTSDELDRYRDLSDRIRKCSRIDSLGNQSLSDAGMKLAIKRARIVAGATEKIGLLRELMKDYLHDTHMLIYCGATNTYDPTRDYSEEDSEGERQIIAVSKMLGNELGMKVTHFTSSENARERKRIKKQFSDADPYQALVAIKCLDEGVNIPSIKTAFILASSTNPKEYVQRRGRVLRKAKGKSHAVIFDFITLPRELKNVLAVSQDSGEVTLINKEITRMREFGEISLNPSEADKLVKQLTEAYGLDLINEEEEVHV
jgi:superfamily II DNA or RNA helicase